MAFVVEDGSGKVDANSLATVEEADAYLADRGLDADWTVLTTAQKQQALIKATDYTLHRYSSSWRGERKTLDQAQDWPREGLYETYGAGVSVLLPNDEVPNRVVTAVILLALKSLSVELLPDELASAGGAIKKAQVGSLAVEYTEGTSTTIPTFYDVQGLISRYLIGGGGMYHIPIVRA